MAFELNGYINPAGHRTYFEIDNNRYIDMKTIEEWESITGFRITRRSTDAIYVERFKRYMYPMRMQFVDEVEMSIFKMYFEIV